MRRSEKRLIFKEVVMILCVLCVFTGIMCYKIGSMRGYNNCITEVID